MRVHHIDAGTMRVPGAPIISHVLVCESDDGLVLVDSGFGLADVREPARLGPVRLVMRPVLDEARTALRQIEALGFTADDVRHVVLTHADLDHAGGISDFPRARVHVTAAEADALRRPAWIERRRYLAAQWAHGPDLVAHAPGSLEWRGFRGVSEIVPGVLLVPLPGHTRGHAGVAVDATTDGVVTGGPTTGSATTDGAVTDGAAARAGDRWVLHAGDAFNHHGYLTGSPVPPLFRFHQRFITADAAQARTQHARLAALARNHRDTVDIVCAHDPALLPIPALR
ncbi:MBL fold metallo-hydrolase [Myceligenerans pegani]|uniref:MBL fold metallo-hydrolase n=1 Tax=Myceligenerans pegani TaxID=2776917 RepID=A0ABR9MW92_9MICO|nr:MBL fold metallo-hydrolase [Myceligenerans sp. TRM 65318]MBE1875653.1 MBL fold metallo-hydrolase [Myceligenerans sp. TRM 65318]MBE3017924.1 MBL fold metallo-hydrolase [Myceligenerans sp. TRM 65318]